jgi:prevent-host-death family protein
MKKVSARQTNHDFSELLSRVERGEEILITKRSKPVAVLSPYRPAGGGTGTASGHRSCHRGDGTRSTLGSGCTTFRARRNAPAMMVSFDTIIFVYATLSVTAASVRGIEIANRCSSIR